MQAQVNPAQPKYSNFPPIPVSVAASAGSHTFSIQRPDAERIAATASVAKEIFVNAFTKKYTEYYQNSNSQETIESWLHLKIGVKFEDWLSATFDEELQEYRDGTKGILHLSDGEGKLVAWMSHSPVDEKGDVYLSQCSLEAASQDKKIASSAFAEVLNHNHLPTLFPGVKNLKLIVREVNQAAKHLYEKSGFTCDKTIDPSVYGASYNNRYLGYRKAVG